MGAGDFAAFCPQVRKVLLQAFIQGAPQERVAVRHDKLALASRLALFALACPRSHAPGPGDHRRQLRKGRRVKPLAQSGEGALYEANVGLCGSCTQSVRIRFIWGSAIGGDVKTPTDTRQI